MGCETQLAQKCRFTLAILEVGRLWP